MGSILQNSENGTSLKNINSNLSNQITEAIESDTTLIELITNETARATLAETNIGNNLANLESSVETISSAYTEINNLNLSTLETNLTTHIAEKAPSFNPTFSGDLVSEGSIFIKDKNTFELHADGIGNTSFDHKVPDASLSINADTITLSDKNLNPYLTSTSGAGTDFYYAGSLKMQTSQSGLSVFGTITANGTLASNDFSNHVATTAFVQNFITSNKNVANGIAGLDSNGLIPSNLIGAVTASNINGGSIGTIPYQSGTNTTGQIPAGTSGYILKANGAAMPSWVNPKEFIGLTDLNNVNAPSPTNGDILSFNGSTWVNIANNSSVPTSIKEADNQLTRFAHTQRPTVAIGAQDILYRFKWTLGQTIISDVTTPTNLSNAGNSRYALIIAIGGGGGGAHGSKNSIFLWGGKASEPYWTIIDLSYNTTLANPMKFTASIGAGGLGGTIDNVDGTQGGDTSIMLIDNNNAVAASVVSTGARSATYTGYAQTINEFMSPLSAEMYYDGSRGTGTISSYGGQASFLARGGNGGNSAATPTAGATPTANSGAGGGSGTVSTSGTTYSNGGNGAAGKILIYYAS